MLDGFSLDQMRTFVAAAETGSFSAAGRRLGRAQSVVSHTLANLEARVGLALFDRTGRTPVLTEAGRVLLERAREVTRGIDLFKAQARGLSAGLEPELAIVVNVLFPMRLLTRAIAGWRVRFPETPLRLSVEGLGAVLEPVLAGTVAFGIRGPLALAEQGLTDEYLTQVDYRMVAAPSHPLAHHIGPIPAEELARHVQLVLSDRSRLTEGQDMRVLSPRTWRLYDLGAKHAMLRAGLGWGGMPFESIAEDLSRGTLVPLNLIDTAIGAGIIMSAVYRRDTPPGPAGRGLIEELLLAAAPTVAR